MYPIESAWMEEKTMVCEALKGLQPERVFEIFSALSEIPHGSKNETAISNYIRDFCLDLGLETYQDEVHNLIIYKPATAGYEDAPICVLQAHMDMVCEKVAGSDHDFFKDPIHILRDGDRVHADGTTLGADDCLGVAFALAVLESRDLPHPRLEVVLTVDEEAGMTGISHLDFSRIHGRVIINLDCSDVGIVTGCAGTALAVIEKQLEKVKTGQNMICRKMVIRGLKGGHSGLDIKKERANANQLAARMLSEIRMVAELRLVSIAGGLQTNAITRESETVFLMPAAAEEAVRTAFEKASSEIRREHKISDPDMCMELLDEACPAEAFAAESTDELISLILSVPSGVVHMNLEVPGLPEVSGNIGIVTTETDSVTLKVLYRSCYASRKREILEICRRVACISGAKMTVAYDTPVWEYKAESRLSALQRKIFREQNGRELVVEVSHGGNECGTFYETFPDSDIVCTGTQIFGAHSPEESFLVSHAQMEWKLLCATLERIHEY